MKSIKTMLAFLMVISMIAPAMADTGVTAWASGSASSGSGPSASTQAHVTLNGMLSTMRADVNSNSVGDEVATSSSGTYGILDLWQSAEVGGYTMAYAADATARAVASTSGQVPVSGSLSDTYVRVQSDAEGDEADVSANVGTIANHDIYAQNEFNPGVMSYGYAESSYTGDSTATVSGNTRANAYLFFRYAGTDMWDEAGPNNAWIEAIAYGSLNPPLPPPTDDNGGNENNDV